MLLADKQNRSTSRDVLRASARLQSGGGDGDSIVRLMRACVVVAPTRAALARLLVSSVFIDGGQQRTPPLSPPPPPQLHAFWSLSICATRQAPTHWARSCSSPPQMHQKYFFSHSACLMHSSCQVSRRGTHFFSCLQSASILTADFNKQLEEALLRKYDRRHRPVIKEATTTNARILLVINHFEEVVSEE